MRTSV